MSFVFLKIFDFFSKRKFLLFVILFFLVALFTLLAFRLKLNEDITDFLPKTKEVENINEVFSLIKSNDDLGIIISDEDPEAKPEKLITYADMVTQDIENRLVPVLVKDVTFKIDEEKMSESFDVFSENLPFFLNAEDYILLEKMIDPSHVDSLLNSEYKMLISPAGMFMKKFIVRDPLNISKYALQKIGLSGVGNGYKIYKNCIFSKDNRNLLMFISSAYPANESFNNTRLIKELDKIVDENLKKIGKSSVNIQYYGTVAASVGNSRQLKKDFMITMGIAIFVLFIFFGIFFRNKSTIFMLLLPVVFGALFSLAVISLVSPNISLIAIGAGSIILGVAMNYSIHFYSHYRHVHSVRQVIRELSLPLTLGSITTIGAFLGLLLVRSEVLKDFGLASALCLVGAVLFTLIFLPFMVKKGRTGQNSPYKPNIIDRITAYQFERNPYIIGAIIILTVFLFVMARKVSFETDMNKLGYTSEKLNQAEQTLNNISDSSSRKVFVVSKAKDLNQALRNNEKLSYKISELQQKKYVNQVLGVSSVLLSDSMQQVKIGLWESFWNEERIQNIKKYLLASGQKLNFREDAFTDFFAILDRKYTGINSKDFEFLKNQYAKQFIKQDENNSYVITLLKFNPQKRDEVIAAIPENENTVVFETNNMLLHFINIINKDFNTILLISSLLVFIFLLMSYGRIELAVVAFVPMLISWVWILGIMSLLDVKFNIFSIIISAFIFGLGDDYSIFIMDGLLQKYKKGVNLLDSYKTAVFLSALTMFVGIGVLIFAKHPALRSIALLTIIGMLSVVFLSYTIAPALFRLLVYKKNKLRKFPVTAYGLLYGIVCYSYFLTGCFITGLLGLTIYKILPVSKKKRHLLYHKTLQLTCKSTMYIMYFAKKKIINYNADTLKKPALIIANHQSIIDIPLFLMFSPKVIMITNDAFYYSKFIGIIVKLGGFLPASIGYDAIAGKLKPAVDDGYSIIVFPEGTRSNDGFIHRFHKGAFYLAEKLKLDILPIVSNGTGNYVAKGEFLSKKSLISAKFLERIKHDDLKWGDNYSDRTKNILGYFRAEYKSLIEEFYNDPHQIRDIVVKNYIYKGPVLEWYTRIKLKLENNYQIYNEIIPRKVKIMDIGCGYGYLSMVLGTISPERNILGIDFDEEKIEIAANCMSKQPNINFSHQDITEFEFENYDVFILSDVLHYLPDDKQFQVLKRCIDKLNKGGIVLIRDGNKDMEKEHKKTRLTEFISTRFEFNKSEGKKLHFFSASKLMEIASMLGVKVRIIEKGSITSNTLYLLDK
ncbi:MAG TPA: MMPL family transporter [Bacteroidales bacterium]|nr:MMPL family transporter [Bacteroidales bacterium]